MVSPRAFRLAGRGQGVDEVGLVGLDAFTSGGAETRIQGFHRKIYAGFLVDLCLVHFYIYIYMYIYICVYFYESQGKWIDMELMTIPN